MSLLREGLARYCPPEQLSRLEAARVGIAGAGGLGSNAAFLLARSGVRRLTIADRDVVEPSNLNRQAYFPEHVGMPKVEALSQELLRLDPTLEINAFYAEITASFVFKYFSDCSAVVEALDGAEDKAMLCRALAGSGIFLVCASGIAGLSGPPMHSRRIGDNALIVGDGLTSIAAAPPMGPRVMQAAAMQAEAVLKFILGKDGEPEAPTLNQQRKF